MNTSVPSAYWSVLVKYCLRGKNDKGATASGMGPIVSSGKCSGGFDEQSHAHSLFAKLEGLGIEFAKLRNAAGQHSSSRYLEVRLAACSVGTLSKITAEVVLPMK